MFGRSIFPLLALVVIIGVFWWLKLVGITMSEEAFCGYLEHIHDEACYHDVLICDKLNEENLIYTCKKDVHQHDEACYKEELCEKDEHKHQEECYQNELICEEEVHIHDDDCRIKELKCEIEHEHEESCYEEILQCLIDEHEHGDACYRQVLNCEREEHQHGEDCHKREVICGIEEHEHDEACLEGHQHDESCYQKELLCEKEEHIHDTSCYSDITADLETKEDWEACFAQIPKGLNVADTIVEVCKTQLDYEESTLNYQLDDQKEKRGYTRYGEWYGNPYGEWSTMFTSFVLHYANVKDVSYHAGAESMLQAWKKEGRFELQGKFTGRKGDVIFLDLDQNGFIEKTGIIIKVSDDKYSVMIGDHEHKVAQIEFSFDDERIAGYGKTSPKLTMVSKAAPKAVEGAHFIGKSIQYKNANFSNNRVYVFYAKGLDGYDYAIDGNGKVVPVHVSEDGSVTTDHEDVDSLKWSVNYTSNSGIYTIRNVKTNRYLYLDYGNTMTSNQHHNVEIVQNGDRFKFSNNGLYARIDANYDGFEITTDFLDSANFELAYYEVHTLWFDGTCGGLMAFGGSVNEAYRVATGETITLPSEWQTPSKYAYKLRGWYDIVRSKYYAPGSEFVVQENTVFYADWVGENYDFGFYNAHTVDNHSTNDFVTTKVFDYNVLFNVMSESVVSDINATSHSEVWTLVHNGTVPYRNMETLNFIFGDHDQYNIDISYPNKNNQQNYYGSVFPGLYYPELGDILFSTDNLFDPTTGEGIIGKTYLGEGDYFFQYNDDPNDENYGYYYYDSFLNAASYNQSDQRFYIYNYLECTTDSSRSDGDGKYSDFLPLNSPYANLNDHDVNYYRYNGKKGEYEGVNHVLYDSRYNTDGSNVDNVISNFQYGMSIDIEMYLPYNVGQRAPDGSYGNKDLHGNTMHFKFTGDDDVWVLLDGQLILDLGGVHNIEKGDINFSTGEVTINGATVNNISGIKAGEHKLTVYYLERGSSQSNCAIYFNLVPRYELHLQKEDYLTQDLLDGAQFAFYLDKECSEPAVLYESKEAHDQGAAATNVFEIEDGKATIWGFSPSRIYYIKEIKPPEEEGYDLARGIIQLELTNRTDISAVTILEESDEDGNKVPIGNGYQVYGYKIVEESREFYFTISNGKHIEEEETSVYVYKEWQDQGDHSRDEVSVYLTLKQEDGSMKRIRTATLNAQNGWEHTWENLPKYQPDGTTEYEYGIEEGYFPGYYGKITEVNERIRETTIWNRVYSIQANRQYQLRSSYGVLASKSTNSSSLAWISTTVAQESPLARWRTTINSPYITFVNGAGQILTLQDEANPNYYFAPKEGYPYQGHIPLQAGSGHRLYTQRGGTRVYFRGIDSNGRGTTSTNQNDGIIFQFYEASVQTTTQTIEGIGYKLENIPLSEETSLKVVKNWYVGMGSPDSYQHEQVPIRLLANGKETGRSAIVNMKNNWSVEFKGLPYKDEQGNIISYSVVEDWQHEDWIASYSDVMIVPQETNTYEVIVTNIYRWGNGYELPSTSTLDGLKVILAGCIVTLLSLISILLWKKIKEKGGEAS